MKGKKPKTWGNVWTRFVKLGKPYEEAAYRADQWERQKKPSRAKGKDTP